jgi:hypothetical protein
MKAIIGILTPGQEKEERERRASSPPFFCYVYCVSFNGRGLFTLTPALSSKEQHHSPSPQSSPLKGEEDQGRGSLTGAREIKEGGFTGPPRS